MLTVHGKQSQRPHHIVIPTHFIRPSKIACLPRVAKASDDVGKPMSTFVEMVPVKQHHRWDEDGQIHDRVDDETIAGNIGDNSEEIGGHNGSCSKDRRIVRNYFRLMLKLLLPWKGWPTLASVVSSSPEPQVELRVYPDLLECCGRYGK